MLEKNGDQDRLKRPGSRGIDPGLHMKPCLFKEAIEKLLILFSQSPPKLPPFLDFLLQNPTEGENGPTHFLILSFYIPPLPLRERIEVRGTTRAHPHLYPVEYFSLLHRASPPPSRG